MELELGLGVQEREMEAVMEERRRRMMRRWVVETEVWKRRRAEMGMIGLPYPIEMVEWPRDMERKEGAVVEVQEIGRMGVGRMEVGGVRTTVEA